MVLLPLCSKSTSVFFDIFPFYRHFFPNTVNIFAGLGILFGLQLTVFPFILRKTLLFKPECVNDHALPMHIHPLCLDIHSVCADYFRIVEVSLESSLTVHSNDGSFLLGIPACLSQ
jgi:hypothetical protein